jgi:hypothetical protein
MNKFSQIESKLWDLMNEHGLIADGWCIKWNDRFTRAIGRCDYTNKTIQLSTKFASVNTVEVMHLTSIHEVSHALNPGDGHGRKWRNTCIQLGGTGKRLNDIADDHGQHVASRKRVIKQVAFAKSVTGSMVEIKKGDKVFAKVGRIGKDIKPNAVFQEYRPRNSKYPFIIKLDCGTTYKMQQSQFIAI